jgi:hypothetical protein
MNGQKNNHASDLPSRPELMEQIKQLRHRLEQQARQMKSLAASIACATFLKWLPN